MEIIGGRYRLLERLGGGGMGTVYRASDRLTGQMVALKRVLTHPDQLQFATALTASTDPRLALAQEFRALSSLRHPNIISVRDYGFDSDGLPYYTMDLLEHPLDLLQAGRGVSLPTQVSLIIQLLQALVYLHRRGFVHRDLKPGNVLFHLGLIKVLDFGLSVAADQKSGIVGTLTYIAPEVLDEQPAGTSADLYAVGVMAYEMLVGKHPFETRSSYEFMFKVMNEEPDLTPIPSESMRPIIGKLLQKEPSERYPDASETIRALCAATDLPLPPETGAIRESFLQAARFVGRDAELNQLTGALDHAILGTGSAWLIEGESGVGKSRLLEELRSVGLVRGALVLRGSAVNTGGLPYQPWRDPLRRLLLSLENISDREGSILKTILPDLNTLLGRDFPPAPETDPAAARARLITVVIDLIKTVRQPLLFILEDFHWAGAESLELLDKLCRAIQEASAGQLSLMVVVSFRIDEAPPIYPNGVQVVRLKRLSSAAMSELSESILGSVGRDPTLVEFLERETEGNVFFVVEVVRALAEEAGKLERIAAKALPQHMAVGGVMLIAKRRLERVPLRARGLLQLAAILGRYPDLDVLEASNPEGELERWLDECAEVAVFEFFAGQWGFAHERLREAMLNEMHEGERRALHRRAAVSIEQVYPHHPEQAAALAFHWRQAGDYGKEMTYAALAGTQAFQAGAYDDALKYLNRALELMSKRDAMQLTPSARLNQAALERQVAKVLFDAGRLSESRTHLVRGLTLLGYPIPTSRAGKILGTLRNAGEQTIRRIRPNAHASQPVTVRGSMVEASHFYEMIARTDYLAGNFLNGIFSALRGLNLAERSHSADTRAKLGASVGIALSFVPMHNVALLYAEQALQIARAQTDPSTLQATLFNVGVLQLSLGRWDLSRASLLEASEIADRIKDRARFQDSARFLALQLNFQGEFARAAQIFEDAHTLAQRSADVLGQTYALIGLSESFLPQGRTEEAASALERAAEHLKGIDPDLIRNAAIWCYGQAALAFDRLGQPQRAAAFAAAAEAQIGRKLSGIFALSGYVSLGEYYAAALASGDRGCAPRLKNLIGAMGRYARWSPVAEPHYWRLQGHWEALTASQHGKGDSHAGLRSYRRSLDAAIRRAMPYERARAYYHLGILLTPEHRDRRRYLNEAREILGAIGAYFDLTRTREALTVERQQIG